MRKVNCVLCFLLMLVSRMFTNWWNKRNKHKHKHKKKENVSFSCACSWPYFTHFHTWIFLYLFFSANFTHVHTWIFLCLFLCLFHACLHLDFGVSVCVYFTSVNQASVFAKLPVLINKQHIFFHQWLVFAMACKISLRKKGKIGYTFEGKKTL